MPRTMAHYWCYRLPSQLLRAEGVAGPCSRSHSLTPQLAECRQRYYMCWHLLRAEGATARRRFVLFLMLRVTACYPRRRLCSHLQHAGGLTVSCQRSHSSMPRETETECGQRHLCLRPSVGRGVTMRARRPCSSALPVTQCDCRRRHCLLPDLPHSKGVTARPGDFHLP